MRSLQEKISEKEEGKVQPRIDEVWGLKLRVEPALLHALNICTALASFILV